MFSRNDFVISYNKDGNVHIYAVRGEKDREREREKGGEREGERDRERERGRERKRWRDK